MPQIKKIGIRKKCPKIIIVHIKINKNRNYKRKRSKILKTQKYKVQYEQTKGNALLIKNTLGEQWGCKGLANYAITSSNRSNPKGFYNSDQNIEINSIRDFANQ